MISTVRQKLLWRTSVAIALGLTISSQTLPSQKENYMDKPSTHITTVSTVHGPISGIRTKSQNIQSFRGIPYAKPPVGELRWRPPQKPDNWDKVLPAHEFGTPCWQPHSENAFVWSRGIFERSEDCLYLNIWTDNSTSKLKPVMVWFHGGGHNSGWGHGEIFDGTRLAEQE